MAERIKPINRLQINDIKVGDTKDVCLQGIGQSEGIVANGTSTQIVHPDNAALNFGTGSFAIAWYGVLNQISTQQELFRKGDTYNYFVYIPANDQRLKLEIFDGTNDYSVFFNIANYLGKFAKYLLLFDRVNGFSVVINGNTINPSTTIGTLSSVGSISNSKSLYIHYSGSANWVRCQCYGYRLLNYIPSVFHQRELYNNGKPSEVPYALRGATNVPLTILNSGFDTDTSWSKEAGWTINGGVAIATSGANEYSIYQNIGAVIGKAYLITYTIVSITQGGIKANIGSTIGGIVRTTTGTFTETIIATSSNLTIRCSGTTSATLDNVSVVQAGCTLDVQGKNIFEQSAIDTSGNMLHGVVTGGEGNLIIKPDFALFTRIGITGNTTFAKCIPIGYRIRSWSIKNNGATSITINVGTTANGVDVVNGLVLVAGVRLDATILKNYFSDTVNTDLYFSSTAWGSNTVEFVCKQEKVIFV